MQGGNSEWSLVIGGAFSMRLCVALDIRSLGAVARARCRQPQTPFSAGWHRWRRLRMSV